MQINSDVASIAEDITALKGQIVALQNSPTEFSPDDQAALDGIEASITALEAKADAVIPAVVPPVPTP